MAYKKKTPSGTFSYTVRRKDLLPKPLYFTFEDEREGDLYIEKLEKLLDAGVIPNGLLENKDTKSLTIKDVIKKYLLALAVSDSDQKLLSNLMKTIGSSKVSDINHEWVENWIDEYKLLKRSPTTIRHNIGALARCLDWYIKRSDSVLSLNPIRMLPKRYSTYRDGPDAVKDISRDRRISKKEENLVNEIISGKIVADKSKAIDLEDAESLKLIFNLALETAMRLREIYTLSRKQIDLRKRTIFLEKTKNGDKRQVPLTSVAIKLLAEFGIDENQSLDNDYLLFPFLKLNDKASWSTDDLKRTTDFLSSQFKRIFRYGGFGDLNFHDTRHEATSRFFERTSLGELEIAKITGHKDMRTLMRYANLRGSKLASKLW